MNTAIISRRQRRLSRRPQSGFRLSPIRLDNGRIAAVRTTARLIPPQSVCIPPQIRKQLYLPELRLIWTFCELTGGLIKMTQGEQFFFDNSAIKVVSAFGAQALPHVSGRKGRAQLLMSLVTYFPSAFQSCAAKSPLMPAG